MYQVESCSCCLPVGGIKMCTDKKGERKRRRRSKAIRDRAAGSLDVFSPDVLLPDLLSTAALNQSSCKAIRIKK